MPDFWNTPFQSEPGASTTKPVPEDFWHTPYKGDTPPAGAPESSTLGNIAAIAPRTYGNLLETVGKAGQAWSGSSQGDDSISTAIRNKGESILADNPHSADFTV